MPVTQSPYYTDPALGQIGGALATALFGNPELRAKQQLTQAQMDEYQASAERARAAAGYDHSRTVGQDMTNRASSGLGDAIASMFAPPPRAASPEQMNDAYQASADRARDRADASTASMLSHATGRVDNAPGGPGDAAPASFDPAKQFHDNLPSLLTAMVQSGHGAQSGQVVRALGAYGGDDEMARRALVAGGNSPSATFAITPERADDIRSQGFDADYRKATGVADINAGARRYAADRSSAASRYGADQRAGASRYGAAIHWGNGVPRGKAPAPKRGGGGGGRIAINPKTGEKVQWNGSEWVPVQ